MTLPDIQIPQMNFATALADLLSAGLTKSELARALNVPLSTLLRWLAGSHPRWHHGTAILMLHKEVAKTRNCATLGG